jgi:class 3 adenylate cyclase
MVCAPATQWTDWSMPLRRYRSRRKVLTVMITDISGSTAMASSVGDHRWSEIRAEHDAVLRQELLRWGGHEIDTSGDGFFATFDQPGHAIACAAAISDAIRATGLDVRIGLHVGEVEAIGSKPSGVAVNIGSRVVSLAQAGEILATSTVRESMAGSTAVFDERGRHELAGVPGEWEIFALRRDEAARPVKALIEAGRAELSLPAQLASRSVLSLMFTDVVGSTRLLSELGDGAWRTLLAKHDRVVGRELKRYGGHHVDQAGDQVFATFEGVGSAVDCAEAIVHATKTLGLDIRIAVHFGEVDAAGGKVHGASVHVGARVLACAEAGEILVTSTAKDSLLGTRRQFEDRGTRKLKGLTEAWHLYRLLP